MFIQLTNGGYEDFIEVLQAYQIGEGFPLALSREMRYTTRVR
jgi:hypothetical protein